MENLSRIAVVGVGAIGRVHVEAVCRAEGVTLAALVDRSGRGRDLALRHGVPEYRALEDMIAAGGVDGVILAVPNVEHGRTAHSCILAGLPILVEMNVSDAAAAPWSWELTARENPDYPATDQNCYMIAGTEGSLALPSLTLWSHTGADGWHSPISATTPIRDFSDPLTVQAAHFGAVIRREVPPIVSGEAGLAAVRVAAAIKRAAQSGAVERV